MKFTLALLLMSCALGAQAASFDCAKARAADEKAICASRELNDKDVTMATQYRLLKGLFAMGGQGAMQGQQQEWLKSRQACGGDVACLNQRYDQRLKQLDATWQRIDRPL
jgi:uncharacterized protein